MIISDLQREENFLEYHRLINDPDYYDVIFDNQSGGVSAIHRNHRFDKQLSPEGMKRGCYELRVIDVFRRIGHSIILLKESCEVGKKQYDGLIDGVPCEIKAVEKLSRWTIRTKIGNAIKQGASTIVLFFPCADLFTEQRVQCGWKDYLDYSKPSKSGLEIKVLCIVEDRLHIIEKPSW